MDNILKTTIKVWRIKVRKLIVLLLINNLFSQFDTQTIGLHAGANLISFYVLPSDASVSNVLGLIIML